MSRDDVASQRAKDIAYLWRNIGANGILTISIVGLVAFSAWRTEATLTTLRDAITAQTTVMAAFMQRVENSHKDAEMKLLDIQTSLHRLETKVGP